MLKVNEEVFYSHKFDADDIAFLKGKARTNLRKRCRLCMHTSADDVLHEMFILHMRGNYVPPHSHQQSDESLTLIDGEGMLTLYNDCGDVTERIYLNSNSSFSHSYFRTRKGQIHSLFVFSEYFLFKEATLGPFEPSNMYMPEWSIAEGDVTNINKFLEESEQAFLQLRNQENSNESKLQNP